MSQRTPSLTFCWHFSICDIIKGTQTSPMPCCECCCLRRCLLPSTLKVQQSISFIKKLNQENFMRGCKHSAMYFLLDWIWGGGNQMWQPLCRGSVRKIKIWGGGKYGTFEMFSQKKIKIRKTRRSHSVVIPCNLNKTRGALYIMKCIPELSPVRIFSWFITSII